MKNNLVKLNKPLQFDKQTISQLDEDQLTTIAGGQQGTQTCHGSEQAETEIFPTMGSCNACSCNG